MAPAPTAAPTVHQPANQRALSASNRLGRHIGRSRDRRMICQCGDLLIFVSEFFLHGPLTGEQTQLARSKPEPSNSSIAP